MNNKLQTGLAIIAGIATSLLAGFVLFPVFAWAIFDATGPLGMATLRSNLAIYAAGFLWIGIASICGGYVTALATPRHPVFYALIMGGIIFLGFVGYAFSRSVGIGLQVLPSGLSVIIFSLIGGIIQQKIALKKYERV